MNLRFFLMVLSIILTIGPLNSIANGATRHSSSTASMSQEDKISSIFQMVKELQSEVQHLKQSIHGASSVAPYQETKVSEPFLAKLREEQEKGTSHSNSSEDASQQTWTNKTLTTLFGQITYIVRIVAHMGSDWLAVFYQDVSSFSKQLAEIQVHQDALWSGIISALIIGAGVFLSSHLHRTLRKKRILTQGEEASEDLTTPGTHPPHDFKNIGPVRTFLHQCMRFGLGVTPTLTFIVYFYGMKWALPMPFYLQDGVWIFSIAYAVVHAGRLALKIFYDPLLDRVNHPVGRGVLSHLRTLIFWGFFLGVASLTISNILSLFSCQFVWAKSLLFSAYIIIVIRYLFRMSHVIKPWLEIPKPKKPFFLKALHSVLRPVSRRWHYIASLVLVFVMLNASALTWEQHCLKVGLTLVLLGLFIGSIKQLSNGYDRLIEFFPDPLKDVLSSQRHTCVMVVRGILFVILGLSLMELWLSQTLDVVWRYKPLHTCFFTGLSVLIILGTALLSIRFGHRFIDRFLQRRTHTTQVQKLSSLASICRHIWSGLNVLIAGLLILSEFGINITPIVTSLSIASLGLGLASQHIFRDMFTGLFIIIENTMAIGDQVDIGGKSGTVEAISLRHVRLRGDDGTVHTIPFGGMGAVSNLTQGYSCAFVTLLTRYDQDVHQLNERLTAIFDQMREEPNWKQKIGAPLEVRGVTNLSETGVELQFRLLTIPGEQFATRREFLRRIKESLGLIAPMTEKNVYF